MVESDLLASTPFYPTVGNHEITDKGVTYSRHFQQKQRPTFRSFDYGGIHVQVPETEAADAKEFLAAPNE